jgi:carbohydrate-selective porin OprB
MARPTGWKDTIFYLTGRGYAGQPSNFTGDAQGVSNISCASAIKPYEAWEKNFLDTNFGARGTL